ncbi:thiolase family protein [Hydrogenophaga intermedia]|uniref:thiolase family protein n=1 Tax=Hydrogenophaga intermedia TaxID=65786 RepID=UPI00204338B2|nr:thiolase family protein [Hydrogenophaga intermedia]MCM3562761.1 thiolase family protein [Hydrogenophaga intermedia]
MTTPRPAVYIAGIGMTPTGKFLDRSIKQLTADAVTAALADAGLSAGDVQSAFYSNATQGVLEGQTMVRGQVALRSMGFESIPIYNLENACASASSAFNLAVQAVRAGEVEIALAVGAEKMFCADKAKMFSVFDGAWDVHQVDANKSTLLQMGQGVEPPAGSASKAPYSLFMDIYAAFGRFHMREFGTTQRQFAAVASKNHGHSVHNPLAQYRTAYTVDEILAAPPITYPLTLPMCAPISDGAAAALVCSEAALARIAERRRAIRVLASVVATGTTRRPEEVSNHVTVQASRLAYERAGVGPQDISVAEVHDATAIGEIVQTENLGFCEFGAGGRLAESGATTIGGRIPVNTSGGLESKGHPIGATGLGQLHELVTQLRGEAGKRQVQGARLAIAENGGGLYGIEEAVCAITILGR